MADSNEGNYELASKIEQASAELTIPDVEQQLLPRQLSDIAEQLAASSYIGTIAFAGQRSNGSYSVQFNDSASNTGYSSTWPAWAFELAKASLLEDKRVWVIANGSPFGSNLATVLILR